MNTHISQVIELKTVEIEVPEFITKLKIDYGLFFETESTPILIWNVQETEHCFNIDLRTVIQHHAFNYEEHFILTLTKLKEDIEEWMKDGKNSWVEKYYKQFGKFLK